MKLLLTVLLAFGTLFAAVDINSAGMEELTTLKGIGEKKAKAIIDYRRKHCFKKAEDLMMVKGIGEETYRKNRRAITVGRCRSGGSATSMKKSKSTSRVKSGAKSKADTVSKSKSTSKKTSGKKSKGKSGGKTKSKEKSKSKSEKKKKKS